MKHRFFYDAAPEGGGGLPPAMSDLGDPTDPVFGAGETALPDLAAVDAAQTALDAEASDGAGGLKPGYAKDDQNKIYKDPNYTPPVDTKPIEVEDEDEDETDEPGESIEFYARVDELSGTTVDVTYPEGVDPISPEGVVLRDAAVRASAEMAFEAQIKAADPRSYAYMVHRHNGGSDEEFFQGAPAFTLPTEDELDTSAELQANMYRFDLKSRGLDDDTVETIVAKAIKDSNLKDKAMQSYAYVQSKQEEQNSAIELRRKNTEARETQEIAAMEASITDTIDKQISFVVPDATKPEFRKFLNSKLNYDKDTGEFYVIDKLNAETLKSTIEGLLFQYKKGDLQTLIRKEAKSQASHKLRLNLNANNKGGGQSSNAGKDKNEFVPLGSL